MFLIMKSLSFKLRQHPQLRFSLRSLMLIAAMVCGVLAWLTSQTRLAMRQQQAVARIRELGGHANYTYELKGQPPPEPPAVVRWFSGNVVMSDVVEVSWHAVHARDDDAQILVELPKLRDLRLNSTKLGDAAMEPVSHLTELRRLDLWCSRVTDHSMVYLSKLYRLRRLSLYSTQVTYEGLRFLEQLHQLEELNLRDTNVTREGAQRLQRKLPNCKISGVAVKSSRK
jgi:hypothetical protein